MDVHRVASRHASVTCYVLDEAVVIIANHEGVVQQLLKLPVCAEIHHVGRHRGAKWSNSPGERVREVREQRVSCGHITVVDHKVRIMDRPIGRANSGRLAVSVQDLIDLAVEQDTSATLLDDVGERLDHTVDTTFCVPDAIGDLEISEC